MNKVSLYQEWGYQLIPSIHGELGCERRYFRVFYGTVHWHYTNPNNIHRANIVFVQ